MSYTAGQALLQIVPDFSGVADAIDAEAARWGESAGEAFGQTFAEAAKEGTTGAIPDDTADASEKGSSAGGAFADSFRARVEAALRALPAADIRADDSDIDEKLAEIRAQLETLGNQRVGIDISDDEAIAKLAELKAQLDEIGASSDSVRVKVDTSEASAELAAFQAEVAGADGAIGGLGGDAEGAGGGLGALGADASESSSDIGVLTPALVGLAAALVPIAGLAAGSLAALPAIIAGAGAGLGALKLGLGGITGALSAYGTQQSSAAKSTATAASTAATQASQAVSNAQTIRNAANSVAQAQESLGNAEQSAADQVRQANEQVISSENALADAQYNEQQAQEALTQARQDAANALVNYNDQLADGALAIQQAQLDVQTAAQGIATTGPGSGATALQQQQAQLTYQQAVQRLQDLQDQQTQLQQTAAAANAAGVDGAQGVVTAQHQLLDAQNAVAAAQQSNADAATSLSEAQVGAVQKVTDAQNALTNALLNQQEALQQIAIAGATGGSDAGGAAAVPDAFAQAMAKLTPQGQAFVNFLIGLKNQIDAVGNDVQAILVPGLQAGITDALPLFGPLALYIDDAAQGIGQFAVQLGELLGSAKGVSEVNSIFQQGAGFMRDMGSAAVVLFGAFLSIGSQAAPITKAIGDGIDHLVDSFAKWAEGGGFQNFLTWLTANGPSIVSDVSSIVRGLVGFVIATEPIGKSLLDLAGALGQIVTAGEPVIRIISEVAIDLFKWITPLGQIITEIGFFAAHWQQIWSDTERWAEDAYEHVKSAVFEPLVDFFTGTLPQTFDSVVGWFQALPGRIATALGDIVGTIFGGLTAAPTWFEGNVWTPASSWFINLPGRIATAVGDFLSKAWAQLLQADVWLYNHTEGPVITWFSGLPDRVATALGDFLGQAFAGLSLVGFWLEQNVWTPIDNFFSGLGTRIATAAGNMWDGLANAFIEALNLIINAWDSLHFTVGGGSVFGISLPSFTFGTPHIDDIPLVGKAAGGPVSAGTPYWVGELGPEVFMPNVAGSILPNSALTAALAGGSSRAVRPGGPVMTVGEMHLHNDADVEGLSRRLSFLSKAKRL